MPAPHPALLRFGHQNRRTERDSADQDAGWGRLVLASASPRRRELLARLGVSFDVVVADVDESVRPGETPIELARRLAVDKATHISAHEGDGVVAIGADTVVDIDGQVLGKPADHDDARRMLALLSGRAHLVHTAVAVCHAGRAGRVDHATTAVTFVDLTADVIEWYLDTGEPFDKAGAYGIQGIGGALVAAVDGSVTNVVGLPLDVVVRLLAD